MAGDRIYFMVLLDRVRKAAEAAEPLLEISLSIAFESLAISDVLHSRIKFVESYVEKFASCKARITTSACWRCYFQLGETKMWFRKQSTRYELFLHI